MRKVIAIAAMSKNRVIGKENTIPWYIPEDMQHFKKLTTGHAVMMGSKTYWSVPENFRPFKNRENIVITRDKAKFKEEAEKNAILLTEDPITFINDFKSEKTELKSELLWIIGGGEIYKLTLPYVDGLHLTLVKKKCEGDAFFPEFEDEFKLIEEKEFLEFSFMLWSRI